MNLEGRTINSSYSYLVNNGEIPAGTFHCQHIIAAYLDEHFSNSMGFYKSFQQCPGVREFAPHLGNEHGQGRVELDLAGDVRLALDDVVYGPRFPRVPVAYDRLFLSLPKLLDSGCTLEIDTYDHWVIRRNGNLLVFGLRTPSLPDPEMRVVVGPYVRGAQNLGGPQSLQNAIAKESPRAEERPPPAELQAAIMRAAARDMEKPAGSLLVPAPRVTTPVENKPMKPLLDVVSKANHKPANNGSRPTRGSVSAKPRDAARKHWGRLSYRALPRASRDTK
ncbi:hypothetical protein Z517_08775 [Fonsecaea pedrosoi CBS 271.37]|uniref:Unplaced genomic scaffold supercont1.5, whole genome shotgun sequence n=1 Tax=Fonsecaea pedrosoi CBS 271.37 TaxID=1442368 RepID=A0A0D2DMN2_9EURO|nr:uncharacterized protein Z517_08775 [Fonsecaea pedrosoi CBS 271.37]KIW78936.1 hypothetical protein Z517_08775 [Fonsecaea pedrosoi CBS 271.37]